MDDTPTTHVELARPLDDLRERPDTIRDAIERAARIDTIRDWLSDLRDDVRDDVDTTARTIEETTGGSFNAPVKGVGTAYRTQPQPKVVLADSEAFARWHLSLHGVDADTQPDVLNVTFADGLIVRRLAADTDSDALVAFVNNTAGKPDEFVAAYAREFIDRNVHVRYDWTVDDSLVDLACDVVGDRALHRDTGEVVPGVRVVPARPGVLTIKPDPKSKKRLRNELIELVGPPSLRE